MSLAVVGQEAGATIPMSELGWRASLPVVALLAAQVGLYVWMAPRGFDFTDESYYVLNYLYWRDLLGTVTFFGAYFEWPFRLLGESIPAIRLFTLLLLLASGAYFALEAVVHFTRHERVPECTGRVFAMVGMAASLFYFGPLVTVRAPSYNLVALCSMMVATGAMLRVLVPGLSIARTRVAAFTYGLAAGACGLGKPSTAVLLVAVHGLFFVAANRHWRVGHLIDLLVFSLSGVGLNVIVLQLAHPQWLEALNEGVKLLNMDGSHDLLSSLNAFRWEVQAAAPAMLASALAAGAAVALVAGWLGPFRRAALSTLVVILIGGCVLGLIRGPNRWWLPLMSLAILLIWIVEGSTRRPFRLERSDVPDFALMVLLLALPVVFSFGTNNPILEHSQRAAAFPVAALLLRLLRLARLDILTRPAFVACMATLCVPTLVMQVRAATDVRYTHRQLSALGQQATPIHIGAANNQLLVDAATQETLGSIIGAARAAGLRPGQAILDFTGDGPGLVFALEARPVGLAWLPGGYPGSQAIAARVIERLPAHALKNAWVLGSDDNPRAIRGWEQSLVARIGPGTHELVATVSIRAPYRWGREAPERHSVKFFRPRPVPD